MRIRWGNLLAFALIIVGIVGAYRWTSVQEQARSVFNAGRWNLPPSTARTPAPAVPAPKPEGPAQPAVALPKAPPGSVVYGFDTWITGALPHLATARGYDRDFRLKLVPAFSPNDKDRLAAVGQGQIHVTEISLPSLVLNMEKVEKGRYRDALVIIGVADYSQGGDGIVVSPTIQLASQRDLRGKRVGFFSDGTGKYLLSFLLRLVDLRYEDIRPVAFDSEEKLRQSFANDQIDAAVYWQPGLGELARLKPGARVLLSTREAEKLIPTLLVANRKWAMENPGQVDAFLRTWFSAVKHVQVDPDFAFAQWAEAMAKVTYQDSGKAKPAYDPVTKDDLRTYFTQEVRLVGLEENLSSLGVTGSEQMTQLIRFTVENWNKVEDLSGGGTARLMASQFIAALKDDPTLKPVRMDAVKGGLQPVPTTPKPKEFTVGDPSQLQPLAQMAIPNVEYAPDSAALTPEGIRTIDEKVAPLLTQFPSLYLVISGHTDVRLPGDDPQFLLKLSQDRAASVKARLIQKGFPAGQLLTSGYGGERPLHASPKDADEKRANRRTEFTLLTDARLSR